MISDRNTIPSKIFDTLNIAMMILLTLTFLYPFVYIFSASLSSFDELFKGTIVLLPKGGVQFRAWVYTLRNERIYIAYYNTIKYAVVGTFFTLLVTALTAFPLSNRNLKGRSAISIYFAFTMFFSGGLIPSYLLIMKLGWIDTIWAITVPGAIGIWNVIIFRTNFMQIPKDLTESIYIDGGGPWRALFYIIIPLSKPVIATIGLFTIVGHWNSFFGPFLYLRDANKMPLQVYLRSILIVATSEEDAFRDDIHGFGSHAGYVIAIQMVSILVAIGPIVAAYPFIQKYFIKGLLIGSIKG